MSTTIGPLTHKEERIRIGDLLILTKHSVVDADGECLCRVDDPSLARLFAAAPEMLAVLERVQLFIRNGVAHGYIYIPDDDPAAKTPGYVDAAIKKARGGE